LVKIIPELSAPRYTAFKVIRSNIEIAVTVPQIAPLSSNLVQTFITTQTIYCVCLRSKVKGQGHQIKGQGHIVKKCISSKNATIRQPIGSATSNLAFKK